MKTIIPYKKEIEFPTKIAEITSISLEQEINLTEEELTGDFIVSGDYKVHSISLNKEPFKYRIPFEVELADNIIRDSIKYEINDFTYDIKDDNKLVVEIELALEGEEVVEEEEDKKEEEEIRAIDPIIEKEIDNQLLIPKAEEKEEIKEEVKEIEPDSKIEKEGKAEQEANIKDVGKDVIMNNINETENTYISYDVHIMSDEDSIDGICNKYKITKDLLSEYNDLNNVKSGSKLLIPEEHD